VCVPAGLHHAHMPITKLSKNTPGFGLSCSKTKCKVAVRVKRKGVSSIWRGNIISLSRSTDEGQPSGNLVLHMAAAYELPINNICYKAMALEVNLNLVPTIPSLRASLHATLMVIKPTPLTSVVIKLLLLLPVSPTTSLPPTLAHWRHCPTPHRNTAQDRSAFPRAYQ
jgi:hypothetical protein